METINMANDIGSNIKCLRDRLGYSQSQLAEKCGWEGAARISNYENGSRHPKSNDIKILAKALGTTPELLLFGKINKVSLSSSLERLSKDKILLPLVNIKQIISIIKKYGKFTVDKLLDEYVDLKYIEGPGEIPSHCFAYKIQGDSMVAAQAAIISFHDSYDLIIDPYRQLAPGNFALFTIEDGESLVFRQYILDNGIPYLKALNSQYETIRLDQTMKLVGVVLKAITPSLV